MSFPLKPAVQRLKIRKNKTRFAAMTGILIFLALLGRFGVRGIGTPELLLLLVTKEGVNIPNVKFSLLLAKVYHPHVPIENSTFIYKKRPNYACAYTQKRKNAYNIHEVKQKWI